TPLTVELSPQCGELLATLSVLPALTDSVLMPVLLFVAHRKLPTVIAPAVLIESAPTGSLVLVPVFTVPSETWFDAAPKLVPTANVPLLIAAVPVKVLLPLRLSVPGPLSTSPAVPATGVL